MVAANLVCAAISLPMMQIAAIWTGAFIPCRANRARKTAQHLMPFLISWRPIHGPANIGKWAAAAPFGTPWPMMRSWTCFMSELAMAHHGTRPSAARAAATICSCHPYWRYALIPANMSGITKQRPATNGISPRHSI